MYILVLKKKKIKRLPLVKQELKSVKDSLELKTSEILKTWKLTITYCRP